jgi:hypothetical protein
MNRRFDGRIPPEVEKALLQRMKGLVLGTAAISLHIRDSAVARYTLRVEGERQADGGFHQYTLSPRDLTLRSALAAVSVGLEHGTATLTLFINNGGIERFSTSVEESFIPGAEGAAA